MIRIFKRSNLYVVVTLLSVLFVFKNWILSPVTLGGDFNHVTYNSYRYYSTNPYIWDIGLGNGLGQYTIFTLPFFNYSFLLNILTRPVHNPFVLHKIIFLIPLLVLSFYAVYTLAKTLLQSTIARATVIVLYLTNPYFIMLTSGGQIGVAFAYGFAPLVFVHFYRILFALHHKDRLDPFHYLSAALLVTVSVMFDSRLTLLILAMVAFLYISYFIYAQNKKQLFNNYLSLSLVIIPTIALTHAHWILPSILIEQVSLPKGYDSSNAVDFFSFARFAHGLTWTHPNYPDNIFGEVKEVSGLAFVIPLAAFFLLPKKRKVILYFSLVALVSAFLIKGTNPPFGEIYTWLFNTIPLFNWYRDATKFFLPLSIAYSLLIGFTVQFLLQKSKQKALQATIIPLLLLSIMIIWWPTYSNQIGGTLEYRTYPREFQKLQATLQSDNSYGRVLWIPQREMYGYADLNHPAVSLQDLRRPPNCIPELCVEPYNGTEERLFTKSDLFNEIDELVAFLMEPDAEVTMQKLGINYLAFSPDIDKKIYWFDRKYDESVKQYYLDKINAIPWITQIGDSDSLLYATTQKAHFVTDHNNEPVSYEFVSPVEYKIMIPEGTEKIHISQTFDTKWNLILNGQTITPLKDDYNQTSFEVLDTGIATLQFQGQRIATTGMYISQLSLVILIGIISMLYFKKAKKKT